MNTKSLTRLAAAVALTAGLGVAMTVPAQASHGGGGVSGKGSCTAGSAVKIKAKADDGRIEVEAEVDTNVNGQTWTWKMLDNGQRVAGGKSTTKAPSGSFEARRLIANAAGSDAISFKAHNAASGESCTARVTL